MWQSPGIIQINKFVEKINDLSIYHKHFQGCNVRILYVVHTHKKKHASNGKKKMYIYFFLKWCILIYIYIVFMLFV